MFASRANQPMGYKNKSSPCLGKELAASRAALPQKLKETPTPPTKPWLPVAAPKPPPILA